MEEIWWKRGTECGHLKGLWQRYLSCSFSMFPMSSSSSIIQHMSTFCVTTSSHPVVSKSLLAYSVTEIFSLFSPFPQPLGDKLSLAFSSSWLEYESGKREGERRCQAGLEGWVYSKKSPCYHCLG